MIKIFDKCYKEDGLEESNCFSIYALIGLVCLIVVAITLALYMFIHAMGISDIAGVHISKNLSLAVKNAQGKLYSNNEKKIKDWIIFDDESLGLSIKYPNDFSSARTSEDELEFKKTGANSNSRNQSLSYAVVFGEGELENGDKIENFIKNKYPDLAISLKVGEYAGKEGLRTGVFKSGAGILKEAVFWKNENKVLYVESRYYSGNKSEYVEIFENVISEINFIHPVK